VKLLNLGAAIYEFNCKQGEKIIPLVLTNVHLEDYLDPKKGYLGATLGRVAGRIKHGTFQLEDKTYLLDINELDKQNSLHGGSLGFSFQYFDLVEQTKTDVPYFILIKNILDYKIEKTGTGLY